MTFVDHGGLILVPTSDEEVLKMTRPRLAPWPLLALALAGGVSSARAETAEARMTRGKLAVDLGDTRAAERIFSDVAADGAASERARAEALVRLGVVQRTLGKTKASTTAFERAMQSPGRDAQVTGLLTLALAGVVPDPTRWAREWSDVRLVPQSAAAGSSLSVQWPVPGPEGVRKAFPATDMVTFDLENVSLTAFLYKLLTGNPAGPPLIPFANWPTSYQPPAAVRPLEFVIALGALGDPRVTVKASRMPWNELFGNVLASNGLGFVLHNNLLFIGRVEDLGAIQRVRGREYGGERVSFMLLCGSLTDLFRVLGDATGLQIVPDPAVKLSIPLGAEPSGAPKGRPGFPDPSMHWILALHLSERPSLEVLDLILASSNLAAAVIETSGTKPSPPVVRIMTRADVRGEPVDLSRVTLPATPR
jgi:hypothetical protein